MKPRRPAGPDSGATLEGWHCGLAGGGGCDLGWLGPRLRQAGATLDEAAPEGADGAAALAAAVAGGQLALAVVADLGGAARLAAHDQGLWSLRTTPDLLPGTPPALQPVLDAPLLMARTPALLVTAARALGVPDVGPAWRRAQRWQAAWDLAPDGLQVPLAVAWLTLQKLGLDGLEVVPPVQPLQEWAALWRDCARHDPFLRNPALAGVPARRAQVRDQLQWTLGADGAALLPGTAEAGAGAAMAGPEADARLALRQLPLACPAELAGLPQVGLPLQSEDGRAEGLALAGPPGSDLALLRLAQRLHAALPAAMRGPGDGPADPGSGPGAPQDPPGG